MSNILNFKLRVYRHTLRCSDGVISVGRLASMNSLRNVSSTLILRLADASRQPQLGLPSASFNSSHVSTTRTVPVAPRLNSHLLPTTTIGTYGLRRRPGHPLGPPVDDAAFVSKICSCSRFTSWNDSRLSIL